jgi:hypothetical protein
MAETESEIARAIDCLDTSLFDAIDSQSSPHDKRSLLACQSGIRESRGDYIYLEIGSHRGGSLQPHVLDPRCRRIYSIDKRPSKQPDARGVDFVYENNSTARMMQDLQQLSPAGTAKIVCFDADTSDVPLAAIDPRPDLCYIDGEHTDAALLRDFAFCRRVLAPGGVIVCHDAQVVYLGLDEIIRTLTREGARFRAYHLPDVIFVIEFEGGALHRTPAIHEMLLNNHVGYLASLRSNDQFRAFANRPIFRALRRLARLVRPAR